MARKLKKYSEKMENSYENRSDMYNEKISSYPQESYSQGSMSYEEPKQKDVYDDKGFGTNHNYKG